jgi:hypothetical protein
MPAGTYKLLRINAILNNQTLMGRHAYPGYRQVRYCLGNAKKPATPFSGQTFQPQV